MPESQCSAIGAAFEPQSLDMTNCVSWLCIAPELRRRPRATNPAPWPAELRYSVEMPNWVRIGDDDHAPFGKRTIAFPIGSGAYVVTVDDSDQIGILVTHRATVRKWAVLYKEVNDSVFRLSGVTWGNGDPHHDEDFHGHWFELTLGRPSMLRYWGDRAVVREDVEI